MPLKPEDYVELMPVRRQKINGYGLRIDYRTYDQVRNAYRGRRSSAADGLWEIHYDPHAPGQVWVRLPQRDRPQEYLRGVPSMDPPHSGRRPLHRLRWAASQARR